jgi:hypothetical protein
MQSYKELDTSVKAEEPGEEVAPGRFVSRD